jgi:tetratricopeptide (TPR) repeat protein
VRINILICTALVLVTLAVYWQVGNHQFLTYDDDVYIARNSHVSKGLTSANLIWAFTSVEQCNWHPVTWISHLIDVQLFGMNPRGHHLANVFYHCLASALLYCLLVLMTSRVWQSAFIAALFALHPLHVESVAWAAERKDILSACFGFLTLLFYSRYVHLQQSGAKNRVVFYILALLSFAVGLMAKPMLVTLPVVMMLLDYWPLNRFLKTGGESTNSGTAPLWPALLEKIPFFAFSAASAVITIYAQNHGGAVVTLKAIPLIFRLQNSIVSYLKYILKTLWPQDLAVLYPFTAPIPEWQVASAALALIIISISAALTIKRYPFYFVGWFWFLITLIPVIGLVQVGNQSMADRYMYIPSVGLFVIAAWFGTVLLGRLQNIVLNIPAIQNTAWKKIIFPGLFSGLFASAVLIAATATTYKQTGYWKDNFSLYRHTLNVTANNYIIHYNLGIAYGRIGDHDAAINECKIAVKISPNLTNIRNLVASTLAEKGDIDAAIAEFRTTLLISPNDKEAQYALEYWVKRKR